MGMVTRFFTDFTDEGFVGVECWNTIFTMQKDIHDCDRQQYSQPIICHNPGWVL